MGAGTGTFTRALAHLLDAESRIFAVDRDPHALASVRRWASRAAQNVVVVEADFARIDARSTFGRALLDGLLFANALHFVRDAASVLTELTNAARADARIVVVEYDGRKPSRWVPLPIAHLARVCASAGLSPPEVTATRPSAFGGTMYAAVTSPLRSSPRDR
jgi:SAM-dependent methyltransferase